jgi:glycosyltransferase involved in cell wall biosynthesis
MFYLPGVAKNWDGWWLEKVVSRWVSSMKNLDRGATILDAHFGYPEGVGCYRVAKRAGIPLFITVRGLETELMEVPAIRKQMLDAFNYCTGIISVSQSLKDMLVEKGVDAAKIRVISNGVDSDAYSPGSKVESRRHLGVPLDTKLIVSLGNVQHRKGYDLLVEAIASYRDTPSFCSVILGSIYEPATLANLEARIESLGMSDQVRFLGQATPEVVVQWLRAADAFVLPTRREGCCNAVLEALSCGVPVITTPAGDNTKFVVDGKNGFIVPHEDPKGLRRAIEQAWEHRWDPLGISQSVHQYTWDGTAEKVHLFFQERLGRG